MRGVLTEISERDRVETYLRAWRDCGDQLELSDRVAIRSHLEELHAEHEVPARALELRRGLRMYRRAVQACEQHQEHREREGSGLPASGFRSGAQREISALESGARSREPIKSLRMRRGLQSTTSSQTPTFATLGRAATMLSVRMKP